MTKSTEPAIKGYFFDKGFQDFYRVISETKNKIIVEFKTQLKHLAFNDSTFTAFKSLFRIFSAFSLISFGLLFFLLITSVHATILIILFSVFYSLFTLVWLLEHFMLKIKGFFVSCPICYRKFPLPIYICSSCKRRHYNLVPSVYGTFYHECVCGEKLPSTIWTGRSKLKAICPHKGCHAPLKVEHLESKKLELPVWGGSNAGKTAFLYATVQYILEKSQEKERYNYRILDNNTESVYRSVCANLRKGTAPSKTAKKFPKAFEILSTHKNKNQLIKLYDPAGETFQNNTDIEKHYYFERLNGAFLIIDPFSLPKVRDHYEREFSNILQSIKSSKIEPDMILEKIILSLEQDFDARKRNTFNFPLAVIINKVDMFNLAEQIGEQKILKEIEQGEDIKTARNRIIRKALIDWGGRSLLQKLEVQFSNLQFFSCAAMVPTLHEGKVNSFSSLDIEIPVNWILEQNKVVFK